MPLSVRTCGECLRVCCASVANAGACPHVCVCLFVLCVPLRKCFCIAIFACGESGAVAKTVRVFAFPQVYHAFLHTSAHVCAA